MPLPKKQDYILADKLLMQRNPYTGAAQGRFPDNRDGKLLDYWFGPKGKWLGKALCVQPFEMYTKINPTTPPGMLAGLWMGLLIQLRKWEYNGVKKMSETIEVTPAYAQYYHITLQQKEEIEGKIKAGLQSVSQSIADLELLKHDERKYREFLDYFGLAFNKDEEDEEKAWTKDAKKVDGHALRSIFIDQVDAHTGEGIAMRNIVSRWPTLITDFMRMDEETDVEKLCETLDVSRAEAVVLSSKNRLFQEWKKLFEPELKSRYRKIRELVASRDASINNYRDWVKPLIRRHKMLAEGLDTNPHAYDRDIYFYSHSQAFAHNDVKIWAWRFYTATEFYRAAGSERLATEQMEGDIKPDDKWTRETLIFGKEYGLIRKFPWLTKTWVDERIKEITDTNADLMVPRKSYYNFFILQMSKTNGRFASGEEFEDADFYVHGIFMSQNVLLVKLLEMAAQEKEFDDYVDKLLGIGKSSHSEHEEEGHGEKRKGATGKILEMFGNVNETLASAGLSFDVLKSRPYEKDFDERIGKIHVRGMAKERFMPIVNHIKSKIGIGK